MISSNIQKAVEKVLGSQAQLFGLHHVGGGFVNQTYKAVTNQGTFFIKAHETSSTPKMFEKEVNGLKTLAQPHLIDIAETVGFCEIDKFSYLLIEWIESSPESPDFWVNLGEGIANLHLQNSRFFGNSEDNYFGSLVQANNRLSNWGQFYVKNRLAPMVKLATENSFIDEPTLKLFEKFFTIAEGIFPNEEPSLLHGDLWKGNIMINSKGLPCLIDPAVYFGHREMDIAMTRFVGHFPKEFYDAYHAVYPLQPDWEIRSDFAKMYYRLAHLNLFGLSYWPMVETSLHKWVGK